MDLLIKPPLQDVLKSSTGRIDKKAQYVHLDTAQASSQIDSNQRWQSQVRHPVHYPVLFIFSYNFLNHPI